MDHIQAIETEAAERYFLKELAGTERDAFEAHYFNCAVCAQDVAITARLLESAREPLQALKPEREKNTRPRTSWFGWLPQPVAAFSLAAAMGLVVFQNVAVIPQLHRQLNAAEQPEIAPSYFFANVRGASREIRLAPEARFLPLLFNRLDERPFAFYHCDLRDGAGNLVMEFTRPAPPKQVEVQIALPARNLSPGPYSLTVYGRITESSADAQQELAVLPFDLKRE